MTDTLIEPGSVAHAILAEFRHRLTPELLEELFRTTTLMDSSFGRIDYLRRVIRDSRTCDLNFNNLTENCKRHAGVNISRRAAFRAGVTLGLLIGEFIPHSTAQSAPITRPAAKKAAQPEREAVAVEA